jgi:serine/threonine protein kinase
MLPRDSRAEVCPSCEFEGALKPFLWEPGDEAPTVVERLGDYELLGKIAQGGMGIVYKGRQVSLNRIVAVKMILGREHVSSQFVQRFRTGAGRRQAR